MKRIIFLVTATFVCISIYAQSFDSEDVKIDTSTINVFEGAENNKIKIDYYHTSGYSSGNRYWYEVIILDTLAILNFKSPSNDDWNYINYQKQKIIDDSLKDSLVLLMKLCKIKQKKKGVPRPTGSGYEANRLYIETDFLKVAGGDFFICIGREDEDLNLRLKKEREISTTISGDYILFLNELEKIFSAELFFLMKDKDQ